MSVHDGSQYMHDKGNSDADVEEVVEEVTTTSSTTTTTTTVTTTEAKTTTTRAPTAEEIQAEYEAQFDWLPVSPQTGTSTSLFSNPNRFSLSGIYNSPHYLTNKLEGRAWLDINGDGRRGDYSNSTINAIENDVGLGNVNVQLVNCETDEFVLGSITEPVGHDIEEEKISEDGSAGSFSFDIDSVEPGRYYLVYKAPAGYRLSGNVLPLEGGGSSNSNCIPSGGEGASYAREAREKGDLDIGGYCARSIGCMELAPGPYPSVFESNFDPYSDISVLQDEIMTTGIEKDYNAYQENLIAMPSAGYLNVGLAREKWPLPAYQYAEGQVTLSVPSSISVDTAVPADFERSAVRTDLESVLAEYLGKTSQSSAFSLQGIDLHGAKIVGNEQTLQNNVGGAGMRMLRGSPMPRMLVEGELDQQQQLEYTFTSRGSYRPPPFQQLGQIVQESINRDPEGLVKSLKDKESLPAVFSEVQDIEARHLTVKVKKPQVMSVTNGDDGSMMDSWAIISVTLLASVIAILTSLLLYRRAFHHRFKEDVDSSSTGKDRVPSRKAFSMSVIMIKEELETYGISAEGFVEKSEMQDALEDARKEERTKRRREKKKKERQKEKKRKSRASKSKDPSPDEGTSSFSSSPSSTAHVDASSAERQAADRDARLQLAVLNCETLKVGELKDMLESLGVSTSGFVEKSEFVKALAEARVDGAHKEQAQSGQ